MKIGIDIDGVLTDIEQWQLEYGSKFYYEKYNKEIVNDKGYETTDIFGVEQQYDDAFWIEYFAEYSKNIEPRKFAREIVQKLKDDGHEIYIITARGNFLDYSEIIMSYEESKKIVLGWLTKHNIIFDKIVFAMEDKLETCIKNDIDIMIEDKPSNINKISTIIPVICFHAGYNEGCNKENVIRCYSWYDIYSKIRRINCEEITKNKH